MDERKFWTEITVMVPIALRHATIEAGRKHFQTGEEFARRALIEAVKAEGQKLDTKQT